MRRIERLKALEERKATVPIGAGALALLRRSSAFFYCLIRGSIRTRRIRTSNTGGKNIPFLFVDAKIYGYSLLNQEKVEE
jgi:hypothetical protein